jgi:large subunit ribosomal protein L35
MPKIKTHKGAASRFSITGTGKIMRMKGGKSHLRIRKSKRVKRMYDSKVPLAGVDRIRISRLLPNGVK